MTSVLGTDAPSFGSTRLNRMVRTPPLVALLLVYASPVAARADVVSLAAEIHAGATAGKGLGGDRKDEAFHDGATGGTYGARLGVEVLVIDVWLQHDQIRGVD